MAVLPSSMSYGLYIPPILAFLVAAVAWRMWKRAALRSDVFLIGKDPPDLSVEDLPPDQSTEDLPLDLSAEDLKEKVDLMTSRLFWFAAVTAFVMSAVACIIISVIVIRDMRRDYLGRYVIVLLGVTLALIVYWIVRSKEYSGPRFLDDLIERTSRKTIPHGFLAFGNALAFVGMAFIVAGASSVIASMGRSADDISHQEDNLGMLLYAGAALLVTTVLEINQLHRWSALALTSEAQRHQIHRAAAALAGTIGVLFTFMLGAAYLPALVVLRGRAIPVHQSIGSTFQNAMNLGVLLSPLLAGLASSFWNSLPSSSSSSN